MNFRQTSTNLLNRHVMNLNLGWTTGLEQKLQNTPDFIDDS